MSARQLTLLDCIKQNQTGQDYLESSDDDDQEDVSPKRRRLEPESNSSESLLPQSTSTGSNQINYITVEKPTGSSSTTIYVSSGSAVTPVSQTQTLEGTSEALNPPGDIALTKNSQPVQPTEKRFPVTLFGSKPRSFNPAWFKNYSWLEYSVQCDACYCFPCRFFKSSVCGTNRPEQTFTTIGFKDWKHATGKDGILTRHNSCQSHRHAFSAWRQYVLNLEAHSGIAERLGSARTEQIEQNRHYITTIAQILLLCSCQDIALRGHRESETSMNRGNFMEILMLVADHDPIVHQRLSDGPKNASYTSPEIQNTLLNVMASTVQKEICSEVQNAGVYSVLADETKDSSKREQLAIVVRYVDPKTAVIYERFLTFVEAQSLNAESLSTYILDTLRHHGLDPECIVSQGYDGASVMSGCCKGVQQRIKEVAPHAIYTHCYAHCLNLVLVDCSKSVADASEFFVLLEVLYVFMSSTKVHVIYLKKQAEMYPTKQARQMQRLSDTRWACRYFAVDVICSTFDSILATLEAVEKSEDKAKATEATGILAHVRSFKFLLLLIIFQRILLCTKSLSDQLQSRSIDMAKAADLVVATIDTFKEFRSDSAWEQLFKYTSDVAALHNISVTTSSHQRSRQLPRRLQDGLVLESVGSREPMSTEEHLRISLYYPILDTMLSELQRRFTDSNLKHMVAIQACSPSSSHFLESDHLFPLAEFYDIDTSSITMECSLAKRTLTGDSIESVGDALAQLSQIKEAFPALTKLLQIALTIAVSTAQCERSFSALKRIKTYLRSTMSEQRLVDLAVLSIERDLSRKLSMDTIVDHFAAKDRNRRIMLT